MNAFTEAGWTSPGASPDPQAAQFGLSKVNDLLDEWEAQHCYSFAEHFEVFTLPVNAQPVTIGPSGTANFYAAVRPVRIQNATIILNQSGQQVEVPIDIWDYQQWANEQIKNLPSQIPTGLYYDPQFEDGQLFFWPLQNTAYQTRLNWWEQIPQFRQITDGFSFPPAYRRAITLTLAEELDGPRSQEPKLARNAANARAAVRGNNSQATRINLDGAGIPKPNVRPRFNFLTGQPW